MLAYLYAKKKSDGQYTNTSFRLQGEGLHGTVPIRVCYFGKPVMEPVMEKVIDATTKKPKLDEKGREIFEEKKDEAGNVVMAPKKDENGKELQRDDNYFERLELMTMFAGDYENGVVTPAVRVIAKARSVQAENGDKYNYFVVCGNVEVPIEVPDFSTAERPDYRYRSNRMNLFAIAEKV